MYWRRFAVSTIPLNDSKAFEHWIRTRWHEKDLLINGYLRTGRFPADDGVDKTSEGQTRRGAGYIETEIKAFRWYEFLQIFAPVGLFGLVLYTFYDSLPTVSLPSIDTAALVKKLQLFQKQLVKAAQNNLLTGVNGKAITDGVSKTLMQAQNRATKRVSNRNALLKTGTSRQPLLIEAPPQPKVTINQPGQKAPVSAKKIKIRKKAEVQPQMNTTPKKLESQKLAAKPPAAPQGTKAAVANPQAAPQARKKVPPKLSAASTVRKPKASAKAAPKSTTASSVAGQGPKKLAIKPKAEVPQKKTPTKPTV